MLSPSNVASYMPTAWRRNIKKPCVEEDMSKFKLNVKDTQDRAVWRKGILGNRLTRAVARKNDVKR